MFQVASRFGPDVQMLQVDNFLSTLPAEAKCGPPCITSTGEDLCYIMFTSGKQSYAVSRLLSLSDLQGSSGVPKGWPFILQASLGSRYSRCYDISQIGHCVGNQRTRNIPVLRSQRKLEDSNVLQLRIRLCKSHRR
jgi:hypothetical protein